MFIKDERHGTTDPEDFDLNSKTPFKYLKNIGAGGQLLESQATVDALDALATAMIDEKRAPENANDKRETVSPVYTYWAQFIDHELTARTDRTTSVSDITVQSKDLKPVSREVVERDLLNRRTPALELDSVYGDGLPGRHGIKSRLARGHNAELARKLRDGAKMRVGTNTVLQLDPDPEAPEAKLRGAIPGNPNDLQRDLPRIGPLIELGVLKEDDFTPEVRKKNFLQRAFIADPRNDENLIVAQFHLAMLRFHNAVVDWLQHREKRFDPPGRSDLFEDAQRIVRWTFQWLVVNDFMKTLLDDEQVKKVREGRAKDYFETAGDHKEPYMPVEFSVACYRFGHSMIRDAYDFNRNFGRLLDDADSDGFLARRATLDLLFIFTGKSENPFLGAPTLPHNWIIEWQRFDGTAKRSERTARLIDTHLDSLLGKLLNEGDPEAKTEEQKRISALQKQLAKRNLRRGYHLSLPTGQALATALDIKPLTPAEILDGCTDKVKDVLQKYDFDQHTPLWFYTLKEAERAGGARLGPLGSRVVAETFIGVLLADPESYLVKQPDWDPSKNIPNTGGPLKLKDGRTIKTIADLLEFAGVK